MRVRKSLSRARHSRFNVLNRAKARPHRSRPIGIEWLELRTLLANYNPLASAPDDPLDTHSLRYAIIGANNSGGDDVITLQKGVYNLSITNSNGQENAAQEGDLDLTQSGRKVTIQGAGTGKSIIDAQMIDRVFQILDGVTVIFKNLTIRNGLAQDDGTEGVFPGETDAQGGGILSRGCKITLQNVVIECCTAQGAAGSMIPWIGGGGGANAYGGGMYIDGGTQNFNCLTVQNNQALGGDGISGGGYGGYAYGGGIFATNIPCLTLTGSKVLNNRAVGGGTAIGIGISDQSGNAYGGGIASTAPVSLVNCLIAKNTAMGGDGAEGESGADGGPGGSGGYAAGGGVWALAPVTLSRTEVSCNSALGGTGGDGGSGTSSGGNGGAGGDGQGGGIFVGFELVPDLTVKTTPVQAFIYAVSVKNCSKVNQNTARGGDGGDGGIADVGGQGLGARAGDGEGGGIYVANNQFAMPTFSTTSKSSKSKSAPAIPPALVIIDSSQVNFNRAIGGNDGSGSAAAPTNCDARGGGIFVGSGEIPEGLGLVTLQPTMLGAVSLNKSTVDCNEAKAGNGGTPGGNGGEAQGGGIYAEGAVWASKTSVSNNIACGGDGAQGGSVTPEQDGDFTTNVIALFAGGKGGDAQGGGICTINTNPTLTKVTATPVASGVGVTLINCLVNCNKAIGGDGGAGAETTDAEGGAGGDGGNAEGGGIYSDGPVNLTDSCVLNNAIAGGNGGSGGVSDGTGQTGGTGGFVNGGGIRGEEVCALRSKIDGNCAIGGDGGDGGGGGNTNDSGAGGRAGGVAGAGIDALRQLTLTKSEVSKNFAKGGDGGTGAFGINNGGGGGEGGNVLGGGTSSERGAVIVITDTTICLNTAIGGKGGDGGKGGNGNTGGDGGAGGYAEGGGIWARSSPTITKSSITKNSLTGGDGGNGGDCSGEPGTGGKGGEGGHVQGGGVFGDGAQTQSLRCVEELRAAPATAATVATLPMLAPAALEETAAMQMAAVSYPTIHLVPIAPRSLEIRSRAATEATGGIGGDQGRRRWLRWQR